MLVLFLMIIQYCKHIFLCSKNKDCMKTFISLDSIRFPQRLSHYSFLKATSNYFLHKSYHFLIELFIAFPELLGLISNYT